ncbi:MAG: hypothetical protein GY842_11285, partial [bacterium]|nr:hypothetical protein [bacterium]
MSPSGGTPQSALSARLGAVATAFLVLVLVLVGCSGTDSADVSLRDLSCTISRQAVALNEALDSVTFAGGCPQPVEVKTVYRKNVGHKGVILPARCSFRLPAPIAGPGRLSARIGFHPGDWGLGKVGLPTVTFAIEHGEVERELVRVDFSDPELADDPRWLRRSVEFPATDGEEITLVVRIEPEADRGGPQAHVYIANLLLHSLESISLSLDQEAKIVRVPRGFRE